MTPMHPRAAAKKTAELQRNQHKNFKHSPKSQRGASFSAFIAVLIPGLLFVAGLAIDGSRQAAANRQAEAIAASAARSGLDASAGNKLYGIQAELLAIDAAQQSTAKHAEFNSHIYVDDQGKLNVETKSEIETLFLSLGGIKTLPVSGYAQVDIISAAP